MTCHVQIQNNRDKTARQQKHKKLKARATKGPEKKEDAAEDATKLYAKLDIKKSIQMKFSMKQKSRQAAIFGSLTMLGGAIAGCTLLAVAAAGYALGKRKPSADNSDELELIQRDNE